MTKLNLYRDLNDEDYVAIVDDEVVAAGYIADGLILVATIEVEGDFSSWPTNHLMASV